MPEPNQPPSPPAPTSTSTLGKYKIIRVIARSNDVVYEAVDSTMNRRVAVKELALSPNLSGQQRRERIERFYREAKAAGNLSHPNIVTIHDVGQDGERHYIAMEYLEGPSLRDIIRMRTALPVREALAVTLQLTEALGYAHSQGVVHRDVKPDNVHLIVPNDVVKLTDFGIARILSDPAITSTGQVFGTPSYMSPEQILSKEVDHRTDIFSLGVLLYEMVVGKKPFVGDSIITITYHVMNSQPSIPSNVPSGVSKIITRALTKDPNQRYQNMASMAADIHSELAFSDSPYRTALSSGPTSMPTPMIEQTSMIDMAELPKTSSYLAPVSTKYAPATGLSEAIVGGQVTAATTVVPNLLPSAPTEQESTRNAFILIGSTIAVMVVVLALVIVVAKAYLTSKIDAQRVAATKVYIQAGNDMANHNYQAALSEYKTVLAEAPKNSLLASYAQTAILQLENRDDTVPSETVGEAGIPGTAPTVPGVPIAPTDGSAAAPGTLPSSSVGSSDESTAQTELAAGQNYWNTGDQDDAVKQYAAAATSDPTGDAGRHAGSLLAKIYSDQADTAMKNGQTQTALNDWQLVVKYAPADPLADAARQKILDNGTPTTAPPSGAPTQPSDQTNP